MAIYRGPGGSGDATTDAASQATVATTKAAEAAASASAASSSASAAATSASNASTSAGNAETSKNEAETAKIAAELAETNAETAKAAAEAALDSFDDRYLGAKASDPALDNDGNALITGALYFNTVTNVMFTYTGSIWQTITTGSGGLQAANNLSDVIDVSTSRTNLGVAIGTDVQAHSAVLDATTASYTTAEETKLAGIETAATADQTGAEIKAAYELEANAFTDAQFTKLAGIEASATADQTASEIKTAYESNADTNAFTDAEQTKLSNIDQGVATTDSPSFAGLTTTANINFGDNDRAIFGAGSDLQIYHNGANSYIDDTGTGNLYIRASDTVRLQSATGEQGVIVTTDGAVTLYHDNGPKIATTATGIDVTGAVVSDGLTVDTDTLAVDSTNNRVGIGTAAPQELLHLQKTGGSTIRFQNPGVRVWNIGNNSTSFVFYDSTAAAERMRIDSSGNVGIGTASPVKRLTISGASNGNITTLTDAATITPNLDSSDMFTVTLGGNRTLANPSNIDAGQTGSIFIVQDGTGSRTLAWGSYWDFAGGTAPTLSTAAGAVDRVDFIVRTSTSIHAVFTANYS